MIFAIITLISFLCSCILCVCIRLSLLNNHCESSRKTVIPNSFICWVGIICGLIFCIPICIDLSMEEKSWVTVGFSCFLWLEIFLIYRWLQAIIIYDRDGFVVGYFPGISKYYRYKDLTSTKTTNTTRVLFYGKKKIVLDHVLYKDYCFESYVMKRYKEIWGKDIPYNKTIPKWDIFKGHVDSPEEIILAVILLGIITFALTIWYTYEAFDNVTEDETNSIEVQFVSYEIDDKTLVLKTQNQDEEFELWHYEEYDMVFSSIVTAMENDQLLEINVSVLKEENDKLIRYEIYNINDLEGNNLLSFEEVNHISNRNSLEIALFMLLFFFIWMGFSIGMVIVGRNPQKYSKRIQRIFFKEGYLRY